MPERDNRFSGNSRRIHSNQSDVHDDLAIIVSRHLAMPARLPISTQQRQQFAAAYTWQCRTRTPFLLDAGCGTGISSINLALRFPDLVVIGVDQSGSRLHRNQAHGLNNLLLVQARLEEFWFLAQQRDWHPLAQFLLYPNPWPKKKHFQRRWHGNACWAYLLGTCAQIQLRSNWPIYPLEFQRALRIAGIESSLELLTDKPEQNRSLDQDVSKYQLTPFEYKYWHSGHRMTRLVTTGWSLPLTAW